MKKHYYLKTLAMVISLTVASQAHAAAATDDDGCAIANDLRVETVASNIEADATIAASIIKEPPSLEFIRSCIPNLVGGFSFSVPSISDLAGKLKDGIKNAACKFINKKIDETIGGLINDVTGDIQSVLDKTSGVIEGAAGVLIDSGVLDNGDIDRDVYETDWSDTMGSSLGFEYGAERSEREKRQLNREFRDLLSAPSSGILK